MLSRILSGGDVERAQPFVFSPAPASPSQPAAQEGEIQNEIQSLRDRARHLEAEIADATRDAFESGRQQGEQKARLEMSPVLERINASLADLTGMRQELRRRAEKDVVQLSMLIAKRVLHRELN